MCVCVYAVVRALTCACARAAEAADIMRRDIKQFARNVDMSLRGNAVGGQQFPKNPTYS